MTFKAADSFFEHITHPLAPRIYPGELKTREVLGAYGQRNCPPKTAALNAR